MTQREFCKEVDAVNVFFLRLYELLQSLGDTD